MAYVISEDNCPVDCVYEGDRMVYIHPDEGIDFGSRDQPKSARQPPR